MVLRYYPTKDATIYEKYPVRNTGLDAILEISKVSLNGDNYNSRILIDFDYPTIAADVTSMGYNITSCSFGLKLYVAEANEIPVDMGLGRFSNIPETTTGVSWRYQQTDDNLNTAWKTGSYNPTVTGSWIMEKGGGTWYTSSVATESFSYTTADIDIDISPIIRKIQSGSLNFQGLIIKKSDTDESSVDIFKSLKFFSKDTHTIYLPTIEVKYDDSVNSASLPLIDTEEDVQIIPINLKGEYSEQSTPKIRVASRYQYPVDTWSTQSSYLTRYRLPSGSQYAVYNANSDDAIIGFSNYTKISDDSTSNYFKLHLDSLQPERYYRLKIRVPNSGSTSTYQVYDEKWIFKVTRNQ
jgi:hypothetical protein